MNTRRLLLDTHVWLWLASGTPEKLKPGTRKALEQASVSNPLLVSIISVWEIALLESKKRLRLPMSVNEWVERALDRPDIRLIGLEHATTVIDSCRLPGDFHPDPADRLLVATARRENAVLVTHDRKILDYGTTGHVRVLAA
jgi:PIN domain nuclease of toxin-antitoxin system